jgi:hypothetical protein
MLIRNYKMPSDISHNFLAVIRSSSLESTVDSRIGATAGMVPIRGGTEEGKVLVSLVGAAFEVKIDTSGFEDPPKLF